MFELTIDNSWIKENIKKDPPFLGCEIIGYLGKSSGSSKAIGLIQFALDIIRESGCRLADHFVTFHKSLGIGRGVLGFPRLPSATVDAIDSLRKLYSSENPDLTRRIANVFSNVMGAISSYCRCAVFILPNPVLKSVATGISVTADFVDLYTLNSDYSKAVQLEAKAEVAGASEAKNAIQHSRKYLALGLLESIVSIATTILGFTLILSGSTIIPTIALLVIYMISSVIGIVRNLYKPMGMYPVINFERDVRLG